MPSEVGPREPITAEPGSKGPRRLHPATLLFRVITVARLMVLPLAPSLALAVTGPKEAAPFMYGVIAVVVAPVVIVSVLRYLAFRYRLGPDELVLRTGVLSRHHRVIPVSRVQSVDVRQGVLQRLIGVAEVHIETAGGGAPNVVNVLRGTSAEAVLSVIPLPEARSIAEALGGEGSAGFIARVSAPELAIAGATANEIGVVAALIAGGAQFLDGLPLPFPGPYEWIGTALARRIDGLQASLEAAMIVAAAVVLVGLLLLFAGWVVSVVGAVVRYHDFRLDRVAGELHKRYGLFTRRSVTVPLRRVQLLRVEESLLRRPIGRAALHVGTAGAAPWQAGGAEVLVPLVRRADVPRLVGAVHDDLDFGSLGFRRVDPRARRRIFLRYLIVLGAAAGAATVAYGGIAGAAVLALLAPAWLLADLQYRNRGYALAPGYAAARAGFFNRVTWLIPEGRIQTLHLTESLFQRRLGLATVLIDTAGGRGGTARIVDLSREEAVRLMRELERRMAELRRAGAPRGSRLGRSSVELGSTPRP